MSSTDQERREGDWDCPECGDLQFARNVNCRKCGKARPGVEVPDRKPFRRPRKLPGDWYCSECGDHQYARNTNCRRCGAPKGTCNLGVDEIKALFDQWAKERGLLKSDD